MKSILLSVISFLLVMNVCAKNDVDMRTYLKKVLGNLGKIESASYHEQSQSWQPGDTVAITNFHRFIKEYTNPSDFNHRRVAMCVLTPRIRRDLNLVMMET